MAHMKDKDFEATVHGSDDGAARCVLDATDSNGNPVLVTFVQGGETYPWTLKLDTPGSPRVGLTAAQIHDVVNCFRIWTKTATMTVDWLSDEPIDVDEIVADGAEHGVTIEFEGRTAHLSGPRVEIEYVKSLFTAEHVTSEITDLAGCPRLVTDRASHQAA